MTPVELGAMALVVLLAAVVRGYAGFGFSALVVTTLSLHLPVNELVPMVLLLEVVASVHMFPLVWRDINWRIIGWISATAALCVPFGQYLLLRTDAELMRAAVSMLVLAAAVLIACGFRVSWGSERRSLLATGIVAGTMNGAAALGGLGAMLMFLSSSVKPATVRATMVSLLFLGDLYASLTASINGLLTRDTALRAAWMLAPLAIGVALGHRRFTRSTPASFQRFALWLLIGIAAAGIVRSAWLLLAQSTNG